MCLEKSTGALSSEYWVAVLSDQLEESFPVWPGPVNNHGLSLELVKRNKAPVSTVMAVISVVAHYKD